MRLYVLRDLLLRWNVVCLATLCEEERYDYLEQAKDGIANEDIGVWLGILPVLVPVDVWVRFSDKPSHPASDAEADSHTKSGADGIPGVDIRSVFVG